jgi:uncharacterized membrane protein
VVFESAKKYGIIASMFNVIMPIVTVLICIALIVQMLTPPFGEVSLFGVGAVLGFSVVMSIAGIIALVLFLVSMYKLSKYYKEPKIFKKVLHGFILTLLTSILVFCIMLITSAFSFASLTSNPSTVEMVDVAVSFIMSFIIIGVISLVIVIIQGVLYWQAFTKLGEKSGVDSFKTAGMLYMIGTFLTIIGIGAILCWIAWIFAADGYRKLQPQTVINVTNYTSNTTSTVTSSTMLDKIYCSYCGTENITDNNNNNIYCTQCGKPLYTNQTST